MKGEEVIKMVEIGDEVLYNGDKYEVIFKTNNGLMIRNDNSDDIEVWESDIELIKDVTIYLHQSQDKEIGLSIMQEDDGFIDSKNHNWMNFDYALLEQWESKLEHIKGKVKISKIVWDYKLEEIHQEECDKMQVDEELHPQDDGTTPNWVKLDEKEVEEKIRSYLE